VKMGETLFSTLDTANGEVPSDQLDQRSYCTNDSVSFGSRVFRYLSDLGRWNTWKCIFLGQILSALVCGTAVSSHYLGVEQNLKVPTAQNFLNYVFLCMTYTTWLACRSGEQGLIPVIRARGLRYFILSVIDVEANYLVVKAYHYTTLTSVQLLDCFTIPTVLALSWLALHVRFKIVHILGVGICLLGVGCLVWADVEEGKHVVDNHSRLVGDMLCLGGATLCGISNIAEEFAVKVYDRVEFLGMLGLFGSVITGIQLAVLERHEVAVIQWEDMTIVVLLVSYSACLFCRYSITAVVLRLASATALNLSLLTADFYSLVIGYYLFQFKFHRLYIGSFMLVMTGVIVFSIKPTWLTRQNGTYRLVRTNQSAELSCDVTDALDHHAITPSSITSQSYPLLDKLTASQHQMLEHQAELHYGRRGKMNGLPTLRDEKM